MLSVVRVHLPSDIPIVGCELCPYVLLRKPDKTVFSDHISENNPLDGQFLRYKWYTFYPFLFFGNLDFRSSNGFFFDTTTLPVCF